MATTDLPYDIRTGEPRYGLEDPLERLQTMLNKQNIDIDSLDKRGEGNDILFRGIEPKQLQLITGFVNEDPRYNIKSSNVRDLNDFFDKDLKTNNPNYIFRDDIRTRDNRNTVRTGIQNFAAERDFFVTPPAVDTQQKIFELLKNK